MITLKLTETKSQLVIPLIITSFIIISSILTFSLSVFIVQFLLAFITIPLIMKKDFKTAKIYLIIFIISISFVFLVYLANLMNYGSPYYIGGSDDLKFEQQGLDVYNFNTYNPSKILDSGIIGEYHNSPFFVVYISLLIKFADYFDGYSTFIPRVINVYFLLWIALIFEYFIKKYANFNDKKANLSIAIITLTPNIQYINSHVFKDTLNLLQILSIIYLFDRLIINKSYMRKVFLLGTLIFLIYITFYTRTNSLIFAGTISLLTLSEKLKLKKIYIIILLIVVVMLGNFEQMIRLGYYIDIYSDYILNNAGDGLSSYVFRQALLPIGIIFRACYAFITPFPNFFDLFQVSNNMLFDFIMFLVYCGVTVQIFFIPFILKRLGKFDWLTFSFSVCFFGIITTTFTFRHVMLYYPFMVALAVDGYLSSKQNTKWITLLLSTILTVLMGGLYIIIKLLV